jgi:hypothetical protein
MWRIRRLFCGWFNLSSSPKAELIFTALAELSTRQIADSMNAVGLEPNKVASKRGGGIARGARLELESKSVKKVVSGENFLPLKEESKKLGKTKVLPKG